LSWAPEKIVRPSGLKASQLAGVISLVLWAGVILSGRFIAYSWFDCDHQPQSALVNALAGCVVETDPPAR